MQPCPAQCAPRPWPVAWSDFPGSSDGLMAWGRGRRPRGELRRDLRAGGGAGVRRRVAAGPQLLPGDAGRAAPGAPPPQFPWPSCLSARAFSVIRQPRQEDRAPGQAPVAPWDGRGFGWVRGREDRKEGGIRSLIGWRRGRAASRPRLHRAPLLRPRPARRLRRPRRGEVAPDPLSMGPRGSAYVTPGPRTGAPRPQAQNLFCRKGFAEVGSNPLQYGSLYGPT